MTERIAQAAADVLEHARFYLAAQPVEFQNYIVEDGRLINAAIPLLHHIEMKVRYQNNALYAE